ncbi:hypothetical protein GCM10023075_16240 [Streptosporangium album]
MFPQGTAGTRPEIYAMGFRNPFRMSVDKATGVVYLGDYGPDAGAAGPRGPGGQVEFDRITGPGFYGWPYCTAAVSPPTPSTSPSRRAGRPSTTPPPRASPCSTRPPRTVRRRPATSRR